MAIKIPKNPRLEAEKAKTARHFRMGFGPSLDDVDTADIAKTDTGAYYFVKCVGYEIIGSNEFHREIYLSLDEIRSLYIFDKEFSSANPTKTLIKPIPFDRSNLGVDFKSLNDIAYNIESDIFNEAPHAFKLMAGIKNREDVSASFDGVSFGGDYLSVDQLASCRDYLTDIIKKYFGDHDV